jgi:hypothetical protein
MLGVAVDLAERRMLKDEVKVRAEREAIVTRHPECYRDDREIYEWNGF